MQSNTFSLNLVPLNSQHGLIERQEIMSSTHFSFTSLSSKKIEVILQGAVLGRNGQDLLADVVFKVWLAKIVCMSCLIKPVSRSFITGAPAKVVYEALT